jgi:glycosyltransferase involved in cell wall biosynthesis
VGGIGEIFGPQSGALIPPGDPQALARTIERTLADMSAARAAAAQLQARIQDQFSVNHMTDQVLAAYGEATT